MSPPSWTRSNEAGLITHSDTVEPVRPGSYLHQYMTEKAAALMQRTRVRDLHPKVSEAPYLIVAFFFGNDLC